MSCLLCNKECGTAYFCSVRHAKAYYKPKKEPKPKVVIKCSYCNKTIKIGILCMSCVADISKLAVYKQKRIYASLELIKPSHRDAKKLNRFRDKRQRVWSAEVRKRAHYLCEECGSRAVDSHHIIHFHLDETLRYDVNNGIALCLKCHRKKHPELPDSLFISRY